MASVTEFPSPVGILITDARRNGDHHVPEKPRARIYRDARAWEVDSPTEDVGRGEIASLFRVLGNTDPYRRYYKLRKLLDVESFLRYMALLEFVGSIHVDSTHNGRLYFNPDTGRFSPIVWDTVAYFWGNIHNCRAWCTNVFVRAF